MGKAVNLVKILALCCCFVFCKAENASTTLPTTNTTAEESSKVINECKLIEDNELSGYWQSSNYPNPYTNESVECTRKFDEGYSIKLTVEDFDLDSSANDYVLIKEGNDTYDDNKGIVLLWNVKKKVYLIPSNVVLFKFVTFGTNSMNHTGFRIKYERYGEITSTTEAPSTTIGYPTAKPNETVTYIAYLADASPDDFIANLPIFKQMLAAKTQKYCMDNHMNLAENVTPATINVSLVIKCMFLWPESDYCVEVHFGIPVHIVNATHYELSYPNLEKIWNSITDDDLSVGGWRKYIIPDDDYTLTVWLVIAGAIILVFLGVLIFIRYFGMRIAYSYKDKDSDVADLVDSTSARQSDVSIWPTQITPPLFDTNDENDYYTNVRFNRTYNSAYNNPNFQLCDESDDEILDVNNIQSTQQKNVSFVDYLRINRESAL